MGTILNGLVVLGLATTAAWGQPRYDKKIEAAASRIIAEKMGELRGTFSWDEKPRFVVMPPQLDPMPAAPTPAAPALVGSASSIEAF